MSPYKSQCEIIGALARLSFCLLLLGCERSPAQALVVSSSTAIPSNPSFSNDAAQVAFSATALGGNPGEDYDLFYYNRKAAIERVRAAIMLPGDVGETKSGFDGTYVDKTGAIHNQGADNLIEYDHFCCSFNDGCTLMDPCLTIGTTLDFLNALAGIRTTVGLTARNLLDTTGFVAGAGPTLTNCANGNCIPTGVAYPHHYAQNDRRETLFGSLYGNIPKAIYGSGGYIFVPGRNDLDAPGAFPAIEAELVSGNTSSYTSTDFAKSYPAPNLLCVWILLKYLNGTPNATNLRNAIASLFNDWNPTLINSTTGGFQNYDPIGTGRDYGYILHMMRATGAWSWATNTTSGESYQAVAVQVAAALDGLVQSDGSIPYSYGTDTARGPEQIGMYLCSADPRVPNNFGITNQNYQWNWDFGDGSAHSSSQAPVHTYTGSVTTTYAVTVTVTDQNGATTNAAINLTIMGTVPTNPPPNLAWAVTGNNLRLSWPADYVGWGLEAQTNAVGTGLGTNWTTIASSTTTNAITLSIAPNEPSVFYRLCYPAR